MADGTIGLNKGDILKISPTIYNNFHNQLAIMCKSKTFGKKMGMNSCDCDIILIDLTTKTTQYVHCYRLHESKFRIFLRAN